MNNAEHAWFLGLAFIAGWFLSSLIAVTFSSSDDQDSSGPSCAASAIVLVIYMLIWGWCQ